VNYNYEHKNLINPVTDPNSMSLQSHHHEIVTVLLFIGLEDLTAMVMKSIIFCDITPCSPLKVD
jgi:hypothetical protein